MAEEKENSFNSGSIPGDPDERNRFIEAVRKLQQDGVRIIDDQAGRARIIPALGGERDRSRRSGSQVYSELESIFALEDQVGSDPYNKF